MHVLALYESVCVRVLTRLRCNIKIITSARLLFVNLKTAWGLHVIGTFHALSEGCGFHLGWDFTHGEGKSTLLNP